MKKRNNKFLTQLYNLLILIATITLLNSCSNPQPPGLNLVPYPKTIQIQPEKIDISRGFTIENKDERLSKVKDIITTDYFALFGKKLEKSEMLLSLDIDTNLKEDEYNLSITDKIYIKGGSHRAVLMALTTFWQATDENGKIPKATIQDSPKYPYRSVMLDAARAWHQPATIRKIVDLCRWYKINYLHLHLTDNSAFTFPSDAYPQLATPDHSYTKKELEDLNEYAWQRGVILVPEIDVPGHAYPFVKKMPEVFGIADVDKNPYTINIGREEVYTALDTIFGEVASVFKYAPYLHIGGDEAFFGGMEDDPDIVAYMKENNLPDMHELFLHFLIRMNETVKKHGKQTIVWSGFGEDGTLQIPNDVIVINWNHTYHLPQDLVGKKHPIVNASFKPLYIVNNRKWSPQYIYEQWHPNRWEGWTNEGDYTIGEELPAGNSYLQGAAMCAWEQAEYHQYPRLKNRVASMAAHLWSTNHTPWKPFEIKLKSTSDKLEKLTTPFTINTSGLSYPEAGEGNFDEHLWFDKELTVTASSLHTNTILEYATTRTPINTDWGKVVAPLKITKTQDLHIRCSSKDGLQIGQEWHQQFTHQPVTISTTGIWKELPVNSFEKNRFIDSLVINLNHAYSSGSIRYELDGKAVTEDAPIFKKPLVVTTTTHLKAQLYDADNQPIGAPAQESYYKIWEVESLTTNKPISASNNDFNYSKTPLANNGRVTLWEMWGDHLSDENWVMVDLEKPTMVRRFQVYTFWDNYRYYQYRIEGSTDGETWKTLVDETDNEELATERGYENKIDGVEVRYLRIHLTYNSANPGLHLVEFAAFAE